MICTYALFCEEINFSSAQNMSAERIFSSLTLNEPGTTKFNFLVGVTKIKKNTQKTLRIRIITPDKKSYTGKWTSPESQDEYDVYNAVFNLSSIPLEVTGLYKFIILSDEMEQQELARRVLKVKVGNEKLGGDDHVT